MRERETRRAITAIDARMGIPYPIPSMIALWLSIFAIIRTIEEAKTSIC